jgi:arylsulfatase
VLYPGSTRLPGEVTPDIRNRSYAITAHVEVPAGGAEGVLIALGDSVGGYALYVKDGRLLHDYNYLGRHFIVASERTVPIGTSTLGYVQRRTGARSAAGTLTIDGEPSGSIDIPETYAARVSAVGMEIGRAPAPAVGEFEAPFAFTGVIDRIEFDLLPDQDADEEAATGAALSEQ